MKKTKKSDIKSRIKDIKNTANISPILHDASWKFKFLPSDSKHKFDNVRSNIMLNPMYM